MPSASIPAPSAAAQQIEMSLATLRGIFAHQDLRPSLQDMSASASSCRQRTAPLRATLPKVSRFSGIAAGGAALLLGDVRSELTGRVVAGAWPSPLDSAGLAASSSRGARLSSCASFSYCGDRLWCTRGGHCHKTLNNAENSNLLLHSRFAQQQPRRKRHSRHSPRSQRPAKLGQVSRFGAHAAPWQRQELCAHLRRNASHSAYTQRERHTVYSRRQPACRITCRVEILSVPHVRYRACAREGKWLACEDDSSSCPASGDGLISSAAIAASAI